MFSLGEAKTVSFGNSTALVGSATGGGVVDGSAEGSTSWLGAGDVVVDGAEAVTVTVTVDAAATLTDTSEAGTPADDSITAAESTLVAAPDTALHPQTTRPVAATQTVILTFTMLQSLGR